MEKMPFWDELKGSMDDKDWAIVRLVQADARKTYAEIGRIVKLSPPAVAERLHRLEDAGVIVGYHAYLDVAKLGLKMLTFIEMTVKKGDYPRFKDAITRHNWILECHHIAGDGSFILKAAVPDVLGLERLIEHLGQFGETKTSLVMSTTLRRREFPAKK